MIVRYTLRDWDSAVVVPSEDGELAYFDDYEQLLDENKRLREALDDALKSFMLTQGPADYSESHWSTRAQKALQEATE